MLTPQNLSFSDADQFLLDSLKTAVVLLDEELRVRYLNTAAEALLELSASRIRGMKFSNCFVDTAPREELLRQALLEQQPYTERMVKLALTDNRELREVSLADSRARSRSMRILRSIG